MVTKMVEKGQGKIIDGLLYVCQKITEIPKDAYNYSKKWRSFNHKARVEIVPATRNKKAQYIVWVRNKNAK